MCAWCNYDAGTVAGGPLCPSHAAQAQHEALLARRVWADAHWRAEHLDQRKPVVILSIKLD